MKSVSLIVDVAKCHNCASCFLADKDEHVDNDWLPYSLAQPKHGHRWINILRKERGQCPMVDVAYLPTMCNHCRRPACLKAAHPGAIYQRSDGIVLIDPVESKGHREIVEACPYGHIWWNEEQQVPQKFTMDPHLLDAGWKSPRCVQACATGALSFLRMDDAEMQKRIEAEGLEVLHPEYGTRPRVYYRNLHRFTHAFIGGSLAVMLKGVEECAEGARVTLYKDTDKVAEIASDNYGDFRFDGLEENSGSYRLEISYPGRETKTLEVELKSSVFVGSVLL